jgi:hypothetical protein
MSQAASHSIPSGVHPHRRQRVVLLALLALLATAAAIVIPLAGSDSTPSPAAVPSLSSTDNGGPNEATRGQAAATAAGAIPTVAGGPDETARGRAVQSSAGGTAVPGPGGPNKGQRGQAAATASR